MAIKEQRYMKIRNKIITRSDVQKLAKVVSSLYKRKKAEGFEKILRFSVTCDDGSSFSSSQIDIFGDDSPVNYKKAEQISMFYQDMTSERIIHIRLSHSQYEYGNDNSILIEGNDSNWVNGTLKQLEEMVDSFVPQNMFFRKYGSLTGVIIVILLSLFTRTLIDRVLIIANPNFPLFGVDNISIESFALQAMFYLFVSLIWFYPFLNIWKKIMAFYPVVELQIAPNHKLTEKKRRELFGNFLVVVFIPIILQIIFEIVTRNIIPNK